MNSIKSLILLASLFTMVACQGGSHTGGGGDPLTSSENEVIEALESEKKFIRQNNIFYSMHSKFSDSEDVDDKVKNLLQEVVNRGDETEAIKLLKNTKINPEKKLCRARGPKGHAMASVSENKIGASICFSLPALKKRPPADLNDIILGLLIHEFMHIYGYKEIKADIIQKFARDNMRQIRMTDGKYTLTKLMALSEESKQLINDLTQSFSDALDHHKIEKEKEENPPPITRGRLDYPGLPQETSADGFRELSANEGMELLYGDVFGSNEVLYGTLRMSSEVLKVLQLKLATVANFLPMPGRDNTVSVAMPHLYDSIYSEIKELVKVDILHAKNCGSEFGIKVENKEIEERPDYCDDMKTRPRFDKIHEQIKEIDLKFSNIYLSINDYFGTTYEKLSNEALEKNKNPELIGLDFDY